MKTRRIVLASRPIGLPKAESMRIEEYETGELKDGELLLNSLYISVDPYMRGRMNEAKSYAAYWQLNDPFVGGNVSRVVASKSSQFSEGDLVTGELPWAIQNVVPAEKVRRIDPGNLIHPGYYLGILGMPGLTAYFGMTDIGKPVSGETLVVSGAAGAVGLVAGQIGKIKGCRVIGIAGSDEKCRILKQEFGFDEAVNYHTPKPMKKLISATCPSGVDIYFDNVGGEISQGVIDNLNFHSRVIVCGQISQYNTTRPLMVPDILTKILRSSVLMKGFIVRNYSDRFAEGRTALTVWLKEGRLKYRQTIVRGFDNLPEAFLGLFSGKNTGKMIVEVE
jgi:NADPH-dependent curcumin reductase CurA